MLISDESWQSQMLPDDRQLPGFQEVLDRTHFHWGLSSNETERYLAQVRRRVVNDYVLTHIVADPVTGFRTMQDVRKGGDEYFCLLLFDQGDCLLRQGRNETELHQGHIAIWDSTRPAMFQNSTQLDQYSILIPHADAKMIIPGIEDLCGLSIDGNQGLGSILHSHLKQVHNTIENIDPQDRPAVLRATVELVSAAFRPESANRNTSSFRNAVLARVQEYIIQHLGDPGLSPAKIAAAFNFSPRYLHRLFESSEESVGNWIRKKRLAAARSDLREPSHHAASITQIAMRRGFSDSSHFSHAFKNEYGMTPRDMRRQSRGH